MKLSLARLGGAIALACAFAAPLPAVAVPMPAPAATVGSSDILQIQQTPRERRFQKRQAQRERRFERRQERRERRFERRGTRAFLNGQRGYRDRRAGWRYYNGYYFPPAAFTIIIR